MKTFNYEWVKYIESLSDEDSNLEFAELLKFAKMFYSAGYTQGYEDRSYSEFVE